ncbi:MAG: carbohydrate ABC transporter permease [Acidimicrobiales bacterium]
MNQLGTVRVRRAARQRRRALTGFTVTAGAVLLVMTYFPIVFVLSNSLKSGARLVTGDVFALFTQFDVQNYVNAWSGIDTSLLNTIIVAAASVVIGVTAAALGAYTFAQVHFRGKSLVFTAYLALLMIPWSLTLIPLFLEMKDFGLYNSWWALILPYAASAQPLLVLIFRSFFEQVPSEIMQSARLDGARESQILLRVVAPLTRPVLLTGTVLMCISIWGDYIWPEVILKNTSQFTISAGLQAFVSTLGFSTANGGQVFAAYVIAIAPLFLLVGTTMRYFVGGMTAGALKL